MIDKCLAVDVSRGTTHDGPGMRTTVFLKGCPLNCRWCQNPESIAIKNEILWEGKDCIGCLECLAACKNNALIMTDTGIKIDKTICEICGECTVQCPANAVAFAGKQWTLYDLVKEVKKDTHYYESFGGGVTVSGGEPLVQSEFIANLFERLQNDNIHCALDTCGYASVSELKRVLPFIDALLFDIKIMDPQVHKEFTGQSNELVLNNFKVVVDYIRKKRKEGRNISLWVRTPLIPGATATPENIQAIAEFLHIHADDILDRWELCAFNAACRIKYDKMDLSWEYYNEKPMSQAVIDSLTSHTTLIDQDKVLVTGIIAS